MPNLLQMTTSLLEGLGWNFLIVLVACLLPLTIGIPLAFLSGRFKVVRIIFEWLSLPFEILGPVLWLIFLYYAPGFLFAKRPTALPFIVGLALASCFIGYMPARHIATFSPLKNILYNGLGLISQLFKWSCIARFVSVMDISTIASQWTVTGTLTPLCIAVLLFAACLATIEIPRILIKQLVK